MNRTAFYDYLRPRINLTTQNVQGMEKILDYAEKQDTPLAALAYILATAWWETGQTMQPIKEAYWLSESWRLNNLRYSPYYGRGLVQLTWKENYQKAATLLGYNPTFFVDSPNLVMEWDYALPILFKGMAAGWFTGKKLDDYIDNVDEGDAEDLREYREARRIVNGTDKAATIGELALHFEYALKAGKYGEKVTPPDPTKRYSLAGAQIAINANGITVVWDKLKQETT